MIDAMDLAGERSSKLGLIVETVPGGSEWGAYRPRLADHEGAEAEPCRD